MLEPWPALGRAVFAGGDWMGWRRSGFCTATPRGVGQENSWRVNVKNWQLSTLSNGFYCTILMGPRRKVVRCQNLAASERLLPDAVGGYVFWSWVARSDAFPLSQARVCRPLVRCGWCAGGVRCFPFLEGSTGTYSAMDVCLQLLLDWMDG